MSSRLRRGWPRTTREAGSSRLRPTLVAGACRRSAPTAATAATLDNPGSRRLPAVPARPALGPDDSLLADTTLDWGTINQAFAAGQLGMYTSGSDVFTSLVQTNGMKADDVRPDRHPAGRGQRRRRPRRWHAGRRQRQGRRRDQEAAAVAWVDFYYLSQAARPDPGRGRRQGARRVRPAGGYPGPADLQPGSSTRPGLGWIKEYINVPLGADDRLHRRDVRSAGRR